MQLADCRSIVGRLPAQKCTNGTYSLAESMSLMNIHYINPFIESVFETFSTLVKCEVARGDIALAGQTPDSRTIVALIGMSGPIRGVVALHLPINTALSIVNRLLESEVRFIDDTVLDGVAELVNIIAGGAKAKLAGDEGPPIDLGLPTVVKGNAFRVDYPRDATWLSIPFKSELGPFSIRVILQMKKTETLQHESVSG